MRRVRWKRKNVRDELACKRPTHPYERAADTHCRQNQKISCRLRRKSADRLRASPHLRIWHLSTCKEDPPPPPFSLPLPCALGKSLDLLFQCLKFSSGEKFIQRDAKTVAQLFNRHNAGILAVSIQDAFNSRCGHTGYIGEVIHRPSSLSAQ